jgi:WbqC-like protein family
VRDYTADEQMPSLSTVVAAHQPQYLPWLGFIDKAASVDTLIYLDNVQFHRRGVQNRNTIKSARGKQILTVPVFAEQNTPIKEVRIAGKTWCRKHVEAIRNNYARAPYLALFEDGLRPIMEQPWSLLSELNYAVSAWLFEQFDVSPQCLLSSELGGEGKRDDLIINLCAAAGAGTYLSGQGARAYQDTTKFHARGITLKYQRYEPQPYPQLHSEAGFVPGLSALDLLLNLGPDAKKILHAGRREPE